MNYHYEVVRLMSDPGNVFGFYRWEVSPNNPDSFVARTAGQGIRDVKIRSMVRTDGNPSCTNVRCQVQVRITVTEQGRQNDVTTMQQIIYMDYTFTDVNLTLNERYINPLGFRVLSYRKTDEVLQ
jgi:type IV secretion system protein VirB8